MWTCCDRSRYVCCHRHARATRYFCRSLPLVDGCTSHLKPAMVLATIARCSKPSSQSLCSAAGACSAWDIAGGAGPKRGRRAWPTIQVARSPIIGFAAALPKRPLWPEHLAEHRGTTASCFAWQDPAEVAEGPHRPVAGQHQPRGRPARRRRRHPGARCACCAHMEAVGHLRLETASCTPHDEVCWSFCGTRIRGACNSMPCTPLCHTLGAHT